MTIATAAIDVLRDAHYESGVRTTLLELARTNICLQSQTFGTTWVPTRATVSSNARTAPDGTTTADDLVEDATAASTHEIEQSALTITSNATVAYSVYVKAVGRTWCRLRILDSTSTDGFGAYFDLSLGATGATALNGAGTLATKRIEAVGSAGWYRCTVIGAVNNARTNVRAIVVIAEGDGDVTFNGNSTAALSLWGAQVEDSATFATSYIATTTVAVTRAVDKLSFDIPNGLTTPAASTFYVKFVERGTILTAGARVFQLGESGDNIYSLRVVENAAGKYAAVLGDSGGASVSTSTAATAPSFGDTVELRVTVSSAGVVQLHQSINAAAEVSATAGAAGGLPPTQWGSGTAKLYVNSRGSGVAGAIALQSLRVMTGAQTLATMQG